MCDLPLWECFQDRAWRLEPCSWVAEWLCCGVCWGVRCCCVQGALRGKRANFGKTGRLRNMLRELAGGGGLVLICRLVEWPVGA